MIKRIIRVLYEKIKNNSIWNSIIYLLYGIYQKVVCRKYNNLISNGNETILYPNCKIALISDEMTKVNLSKIFTIYVLTPFNWKKTFSESQIDYLFCEATWTGVKETPNVWRGCVGKNENCLFETRKELLKIVQYCKMHGIKTIFWNKEDPTYMGNRFHNFADTACKFEYIYTTAQECVSYYKENSKAQVAVLEFGYPQDVFWYDTKVKKKNKAVFAGSWYKELPERCADMCAIFDNVLERGIDLEIYDRYSESNDLNHKYPEKYKKYIKKAVDYEELGEIYREAKYAININSEKKSKTMFARRVYEAMACGCIIISNESLALQQLFKKNIWYIQYDEKFEDEDEKIENNLKYVQINCTSEMKFVKMIKDVK